MTISLNINQIKRYLPHRYPFLFIDSVEEVVPGEHIRGKKAVTGNEDFFNGHFPGNPVVPGVIQIEAMGQCGALLAILSGAEVDAEKQIYVATIDLFHANEPWAKLRRPAAVEFLQKRLSALSGSLGDKPFLDGARFTAGDLMMTTVLRILKHTDIVTSDERLAEIGRAHV